MITTPGLLLFHPFQCNLDVYCFDSNAIAVNMMIRDPILLSTHFLSNLSSL